MKTYHWKGVLAGKKRKKGKKKIVGKPHLLCQVEVAPQKKKIVIIKRKCGQFCPNIFVQLSLSFSLKFGEIVFWRGRRENWWVPPKSLLFSTLNQTTKNIIFSPLFSPSFSILPKITPNKYSLRDFESEGYQKDVIWILYGETGQGRSNHTAEKKIEQTGQQKKID